MHAVTLVTQEKLQEAVKMTQLQTLQVRPMATLGRQHDPCGGLQAKLGLQLLRVLRQTPLGLLPHDAQPPLIVQRSLELKRV